MVATLAVIVRRILHGPLAFAAVELLEEQVAVDPADEVLQAVLPPHRSQRGSFGYQRHSSAAR